ncbi:DUF4355 domain-containing protein [Psychrobacillus lasiicapitis]|uniref:DUF4355 domain-containing protein n=2 Tax=Psychrobacillus lasiicapitis TaxID=1636719 RepID=A0A544TAW8_9BACI|nr:DUF4355 domain-containing protein [Psychrobacillus lasiicapitis]
MIFVSKATTASKPVLPLRLNIQYFSDPAGPPTDPVDPPADPPSDPPAKVEFTAEQQAELDRILGERLGKAQAKWEKDYQTKLEAAKTEAEKLAKMNADQKAEYEAQKREDELAKREEGITRRELRATALETLADKSLPKILADILVYTDAETTNTSLDAVEKAFREAVETGVNERLKGTPPGGGGGSQQPKGYDAGKSFAEQRNQKGSGK